MATPYSAIENSFLNKITDDLLLSMVDEDIEAMLDSYRVSASVMFKQCAKLSDTDDVKRVYSTTLTNEEIEILANLMVLEWLKQRINSMELLRMGMSTKDFRTYKQSEHLNSLLALKKDTLGAVDRLIVSYTYSKNKLSDLRKV